MCRSTKNLLVCPKHGQEGLGHYYLLDDQLYRKCREHYQAAGLSNRAQQQAPPSSLLRQCDTEMQEPAQVKEAIVESTSVCWRSGSWAHCYKPGGQLYWRCEAHDALAEPREEEAGPEWESALLARWKAKRDGRQQGPAGREVQSAGAAACCRPEAWGKKAYVAPSRQKRQAMKRAEKRIVPGSEEYELQLTEERLLRLYFAK